MNKKQIGNLIFLVFVFAVTCYTVFSGKDLSDILYWISHVKDRYLFLGILIIPIFVCCESVIIKYLMMRLGKKVPFASCAQYSFIGFFFSCITPSATGGQPAQVLKMQEDGIDIPLSSLVLLVVTIGYKLVLVFVGFLCYFFAHTWLLEVMEGAVIFFYLGMFLNVIGITGLLFLVFSPTLASSVTCRLVGFLEGIRLLKKKKGRMEKISQKMKGYHQAAGFIKSNKQVLVPVMAISFFQRLVLFFITYLVYLSFELEGEHLLTILALQAIISLSVDMLPLPGGMGISENLFLLIFTRVFGSQLILPAMLLSRGISFYILLLLSAAVTIYSSLNTDRKGGLKYDRIL